MSPNVRLFLLFLTLLRPTTSVLPDIIKLCKDVSCEVDDEYADVPVRDSEKDLRWMAGGLPLIFWESVITGSLFNQTDVSSACRAELTRVADGLQRDDAWAFEFVDSSGKSPPGLLKATITAIGDYDQCLDIDSHDVRGMYCMLDVYHLNKKTSRGQLAMSRVRVFGGYPFLSSLCLPSACQAHEVQAAAKQLLKPFMIKVAGDITCETKEDISWITRMSSLTGMQMLSITLISAIIASVVIATAGDVFQRLSLQPQTSSKHPLLSSLSLLESSRRLFMAKDWKFDILVFDGYKLLIIFVGTLAHLMVCVESPHGYAMIGTHKFFRDLMSSPSTQFLANDCGLLGVPFLSGIATFSLLYPLAKKHKLSYFSVIFERVTRFLPPILILTACEFVWPIFGSGPLHKRVADFTLQKCEKNWMYNAIFANNFIRSIDICGGHLFSSSVDMQLFLMGLVVILVFARSERLGVLFSVILMVVGTIQVAYNAIVHNLAFSMYTVDPPFHEIENFLFYVHMQTPSYMSAYFTGVLVAHYRSKGYLQPDLSGLKNNVTYLLLAALLAYSVNFNAMTHNVFKLWPQHLNWLFISLNRILQITSDIALFVYLMGLRPFWDKWYNHTDNNNEKTVTVDSNTESFSPFKALCRLCFPLYICNYLYIRSEFFNRRSLIATGAFWTIKRLVSSTVFVYIFTVVFHLFLLAPVEAIRQHLMSRSSKKHEHTE